MQNLVTERLTLRQWQPDDLEPFAAINADPIVMEYFPATLTRSESDALVDRMIHHWTVKGFGFWAVALRQTGELIGLTGLSSIAEGIPNAPFVEVGWRMAARHWGQGYAPEAARAAVSFGFDSLHQSAIYSFTALQNLRSQRVMEKIGMTHLNQNFNHPKLPAGHGLSKHCLYRITPNALLK